MTLRLDLPPDLAERLRQAAEKQGLSADRYTLHLLKEHLPPVDRRGISRADPIVD